MAKKKIVTKKNAFILFLLGCLGAAIVAGVLHAGAATDRLAVAELKVEAAQAQVIDLKNERISLIRQNIMFKMIIQMVSSRECPAPIECPEPEVYEPQVCPEPVECPAPVTCEPEIITIRVIEEKEVIKEIRIPIECPTTPVEFVKQKKKVEGFTPYVDLLGRTNGTAGARLGIDKEIVHKPHFSLRFFAEISHDIIQDDQEAVGIELNPYYCEEFQCTEAVDAPQQDRTRGNFGIRFRF
jgi:hypothetical protein